MITNTGKNLLAKYLVGQTQSYASHIAVGCGPTPVASDGGNFGDYSLKQSLDFEMFRVPIISRGFVNEDGKDKIVLTAELPTEERYEITEVGVFSAASNPVAGSFDSRNVYSFADTDNWLYQPFGSPAVEIPPVYTPLDGDDDNGIINVLDEDDQPINVFATNADNRIFTNSNRVARNERCRFLNNIIAIVGNDSTLTRNSSGKIDVSAGSKYIRLNETTVDFTKNSPLDELRLAFSVINKVPGTSLVPATVPDNVKILLEFSYTGPNSTQEYAKFEVDIDHQTYAEGTATDKRNLATNRYLVVNKKLKDLNKSDNFDWREVSVAKIYACVTDSGSPSDLFYVCLDGLRIENITSTNSLYGLTGYSVIKSVGSRPIIKSANTTNYIEFRFALDVG
jgi:hypothetical protein